MPSPSSTSNPRQLFFALIKILLTFVILYFLYLQVDKHWHEIKDYQWQFDFTLMIFSLVLALLSLMLFSIIWRLIISCLGYSLSIPISFRIFYLSNLGRYVPGKVWQLFGILYLTKKEGIPPEAATASFMIAQLYALPASFFAFILAAQFEPGILTDQVAFMGERAAYLLMAVMLVICIVIILWPGRILAIGNIFLRKFSRPEVIFNPDIKVALKLFVSYFISWFAYGTAFMLFINSIVPDANLSLLAGIGIFNAAYQLGYLVLFAPGGFGPREIVMGIMLTPFVGPIAPAVAIMARLWSLLIESIAALLAVMIRKNKV